MIAGLNIVWRRASVGREGKERERETGRKERREEVEAEDSSMRLRRAMMKSIKASWNRSTISETTVSEGREERERTNLRK